MQSFLSNLDQVASNKALSLKNYMEYDCKDRRIRVLEESSFSEYWAQGATLSVVVDRTIPGDWNDIFKGSAADTNFLNVFALVMSLTPARIDIAIP